MTVPGRSLSVDPVTYNLAIRRDAKQGLGSVLGKGRVPDGILGARAFSHNTSKDAS